MTESETKTEIKECLQDKVKGFGNSSIKCLIVLMLLFKYLTQEILKEHVLKHCKNILRKTVPTNILFY